MWEPFYSKDDLQRHKIAKNKVNVCIEMVLKQQNDLQMKICQQRIVIYDKILKIQKQEMEKRAICKCKGPCKIDHLKYRWSQSKSDNLLKQVSKVNKNKATKVQFKINKSEVLHFNCDECEFIKIIDCSLFGRNP